MAVYDHRSDFKRFSWLIIVFTGLNTSLQGLNGL